MGFTRKIQKRKEKEKIKKIS